MNHTGRPDFRGIASRPAVRRLAGVMCVLLAIGAGALLRHAAAQQTPPDSTARVDTATVVAAPTPDWSTSPLWDPLRAGLAHYRELSALPWPGPLPEARRVDPGERWAGLAVMAARLRVLGDLAPADSAVSDSVYAEPLVGAVKRFQARHALAPDGVLGRATLAHLEVPPAARAAQIERTLARLRELPDPGEGPLLLVNIPAFRLYAWEDSRREPRPSLTMNVVVGRADSLQTPVFSDRLRYIIFRPFWHPPRSIIVHEILPAIERDPGYLDTHDMELCPSANDVAPALPLRPETLQLLRDGFARVRQRPGPDNTLGLVKFMFPNTHTVYLHDTSSRGAFRRARRDVSHGCVRVEEPRALAEFVLRGEPGWTTQRVRDTIDGDRTVRADLVVRRLPVRIAYLTAFPAADGGVEFYADIYALDAPAATPATAAK